MGENLLQNIQEKLEEISQSTINFVYVNMAPSLKNAAEFGKILF